MVEKGELSTALYFIRTGSISANPHHPMRVHGSSAGTLKVEENQKELGPGCLDFYCEGFEGSYECSHKS